MIPPLFFLRYVQRYACIWTFQILLLLLATCMFSIAALAAVQAYLIVPGCNLPILWATEFCQMVASQALSHPVTSAVPWVCGLPIISQLPSCSNAGPSDSFRSSRAANNIAAGIKDQFRSYNQLVVGSAAAPMFGRDVREIVLSLDDMVVLLKGSSFEGKDAIISQLLSIRHASRESAYKLQKYTSRLLSSINLIMTASQSAIEAAQFRDSSHVYSKIFSKLAFWRSPGNGNQRIHVAFLHAIKTFEVLGRDLYHLNGETQEAVSILDSHIEVLVDLVFHHLTGANKELGDVLSWFWTRLGGHRSILHGAKQRVTTLEAVGKSTKAMRSFVLDVQLQLEKLQTAAEELRGQAAEPLLIDGSIPVVNVIQALQDGCKLLKKEVWGTSTYLE